ncbi:sporulation integral membrane protein YtvI [Peribacillus sp. SCS-155]|uniref:sporulation integral membrane protein YtvI n=1 Tax=Peribacillus sedimenti TaxID=3115297 RepID=UPI003905CF5F
MNTVIGHRIIRFIFVVLAFLIGSLFIFYLSQYTYPFIIAIILAFLMNPTVNFLQIKLRLPRALSVLCTMLFIFFIVAGCITLLVTEIVSGATYLGTAVPHHLQTIIHFMEDFIADKLLPFYNSIALFFNDLDSNQQQAILKNIQSIGEQIGSSAGNFVQAFFLNIPSIIAWIPSTATALIFSLLGTFFISKDWYRLSRLSHTILPSNVFSGIKRVFEDLKKALFGFIRAQFTLVSLTIIIVLAGLLILNIKYAITIALVCGIVDILPYLGTGTVFIPWIIYESITGHTSLAAGLGVLYVVVIVQRQLMEPKVLSSSIGLNPLATLIALFAGFKLFGFLGLITGPVILVIINTLYKANFLMAIWNFILGKEPGGRV